MGSGRVPAVEAPAFLVAEEKSPPGARETREIRRARQAARGQSMRVRMKLASLCSRFL